MNFTPLIKQFGAAITIFEGYIKPCLTYPFGSASYRNNNPGNMRYTPYTVSLGATGRSPMGFARFPTYQMGMGALCQMLTDACSGKLAAYHGDMTLLQFFFVYAPPTDGNNPIRYANFISMHMGVSVSQPIQTLIS